MRSISNQGKTTPPLSDADICYVWQLVRQAGQLAVTMRDGVSIVEKSGPQDKVTAADLELSRIICERLSDRFQQDVVISEEGTHPTVCSSEDRIWLVDPIDGTDNYIRNDGQYAVMIGLLVAMKPVFGWVYQPTTDCCFLGGPESGSFLRHGTSEAKKIAVVSPICTTGPMRIMMGFRDRKSNPWVNDLPQVEWVKSGSVGLKVGKIINDEADVFIHLSGRLKVWDTAGPVAIALGAGLEVGRLEGAGLDFPLPNVEHHSSVVIGRTGSISWARQHVINQAADLN